MTVLPILLILQVPVLNFPAYPAVFPHRQFVAVLPVLSLKLLPLPAVPVLPPDLPVQTGISV